METGSDGRAREGFIDALHHNPRQLDRAPPLHVLPELGGWASPEMVQRYAHLATEHLSANNTCDHPGLLAMLRDGGYIIDSGIFAKYMSS